MNLADQVLVSCIMPTADRRRFVPRAIHTFLNQDYPNRELVILDDGADKISDLVPDDPRIHYIPKAQKQTLGAKRNECVKASHGDFILHWDDDDWSAPRRISYQVEALLREGAEVCGLRQMLFYDLTSGCAWLYDYPAGQRSWLAGGSLLYTRQFWQRAPFPNVQVGEDTRFVWSQRRVRLFVLPDYNFYVAMIHPGNTSKKICSGLYWSRWSGDLRRIMGRDLDLYRIEPRELGQSQCLEARPGLAGCAVSLDPPPREFPAEGRTRACSTGSCAGQEVAPGPVSRGSLSRNAKQPAYVSGRIGQASSGGTGMSPELATQELQPGLSAVVCHGGQIRLPHLAASLANMRQCQGVSEIIVVDMGTSPSAEDVARRWADKYIFIRNGDVFERARALNIGAAMAEFDLVLWRDNDLIMPTDFIDKAVAEMRAERLDYLIPYSAINYLSEADSCEVIHGTRSPADCKPVRVLRAREIHGGFGILRTAFFVAYGGMSEEFLGWGGEDDAWWVKACLLGKAGCTTRPAQFLYHLFHSNSGAYGGNVHISNSPHYAKNLVVLREMCSMKDANSFMKRFPPRATLSCGWENKRVVFLAQPSAAGLKDQVSQVGEILARLSGVRIDCRVVGSNGFSWKDLATQQELHGMVVFGTALGKEFLADESLEALWPKAIVQYAITDLTAEAINQLRKTAGVWSEEASAARKLKQAGLRSWPVRGIQRATSTPLRMAVALLQPLSLTLGGAGPVCSPPKRATLGPAAPSTGNGHKRMSLPVWMYWEGECPEWIQRCQQTVFAHAADVRLISPAEFDKLRNKDRDIDLAKLHVVHRADYVRAFLLAQYGGLWIDSDCLVMQSLQPILDSLCDYDFVAHRERRGVISNDLIAARQNSQIASAFYRRVCEILRSRRPLTWTGLGSEPLTSVLQKTRVPWHEIECELIQPICWSNPSAFFEVNSAAEHEHNFNSRAICYMLSNVTLQHFQAANPSKNIMGERTFFQYLLTKSLNERTSAPVELPKTPSAPGRSSWQALPFCVEAMVEVSPNRVLDLGVGLGMWGMLVREFCEERNEAKQGQERKVHLEGIRISDRRYGEHQAFLYDRVHTTTGSRVAEQMSGHWNLAIVGDALDQWPKDTSVAVLERALEISDYVLVHNPMVRESDGAQGDSSSGWRISDFLSTDPVRFAVFNHDKSNEYGAFLFSRNDPLRLKTPGPMEKTFTQVLRQYVQAGGESVSGPGSSLVHTMEIRERLPLLIEDIGVESLLDAPCGDFNWMQHVRLGIEEYIGIDVIPNLIAQNQQRFGRPGRKFMTIDMTIHNLPRVDLILCRDGLVHFCYEDIFRALKTFKGSRSTYLLTTTFANCQVNRDINTGGWRPLNLQLYPFNFPEPLRLINEKCKEDGGRYPDKSLGLWNLEHIP